MATKSRPILFSTPMVQSILAGTKTQTRRVIKSRTGFFEIHSKPGQPPHAVVEVDADGFWGDQPKDIWCPYGYTGDQLWIRETTFFDKEKYMKLPLPVQREDVYFYQADGYELKQGHKWTPSIFMRKQASRITLEITNIRVERLTDISEEDAKVEGVNPFRSRYDLAFADLWEKINGGGSWKQNPWVWVIEFKKI